MKLLELMKLKIKSTRVGKLKLPKMNIKKAGFKPMCQGVVK